VANKAAASLRIGDAQSPRLGWPSIMGDDTGDPGSPAALCKLGMGMMG